MLGNKDFKTFVDEHYSDLGGIGNRVLNNVLLFGVLGATHLKKQDLVLSIDGKRNLLKDVNVKAGEAITKGNHNEALKHLEVAEDIIRQLSVAKATFKIQTNGKGMGGDPARVFRPDKGLPSIRVNAAKLEAGMLPHEIFHVVMKSRFAADLGISKAFKSKVKFAVDKVLGKGKLEEKIEEKYKEQGKDTFDEEYSGNLVEMLTNPAFHGDFIANNVWGQLQQDVKGLKEKLFLGTRFEKYAPKLNTALDVVHFFARLGASWGKGEYNPLMLKRLDNIKIQGKKLIN